MSTRVHKQPINIPKGVTVEISPTEVAVKGPKGSLVLKKHSAVQLATENGQILVSPDLKQAKAHAQAGTARALLQNMVVGVTDGYVKKLKLVGVGYKAAVVKTKTGAQALELNLGFSHVIYHVAPEGISFKCDNQIDIEISGFDKQVVGEVAAQIRRYRPPECYKGKGVRYSDEVILLKETKKK